MMDTSTESGVGRNGVGNAGYSVQEGGPEEVSRTKDKSNKKRPQVRLMGVPADKISSTGEDFDPKWISKRAS